MPSSRPVVHSVELSSMAEAENQPPPPVRMADIQGSPGTRGSLLLRLLQFVFAVATLCIMTTSNDNDFASVAGFKFLVLVSIIQILWSISLAVVDAYALLVSRSLRTSSINWLLTIGDGIISTLMFMAVFASLGIVLIFWLDSRICGMNHCISFGVATVMGFVSWLAIAPSFMLNAWLLPKRI